jgi:copper chaperone
VSTTAKTILNVPDISCGHCVLTITKALQPLAGVRNVKVSIPTRQVEVEYDENLVGIDRMAESLAEENYPVAAAEEAPPESTRGSGRDGMFGESYRMRGLPPRSSVSVRTNGHGVIHPPTCARGTGCTTPSWAT